MAETAEDVIKADDVPDKEVNNATDPDSTTAEMKTVEDIQQDAAAATEGEVQANGTDTSKDPIEASDVPEKDVVDATDPDSKATEAKVAEKVGEENGSRSPENKRKEAPVSISAHDRYDRNKRQRGGGHGSYGKQSKIKTRFDDQPESNDAEDIRRQVEFYFSDSNLPIDAYLLNETGGHRNRPVPLKVIHNFKRMRHFQPYGAVRDAVAESEFLTLNDDDEISRRIPLSDKFTDNPAENRGLVHTSSMSRSIYAKGFGEEKGTTHLDIETFFQPYGPIKAVRLRRHDDGEFKGSVFVEFDSEETQRQFLELDPKPQWEGEKELEIMSKQEYVDMKHHGIMEGTVKPKSPTDMGRGRGRGGRGGGFRGDRRDGNRDGDRRRRNSREWIDKDDWKTRRDRDQEDDRDDRRGGRGRGRGHGGRGGRGDRGGRRRSPDFRDRDRKRRRDDDDEERDVDRDEQPTRAEAEAKKMKMDDGDRAAQPNGDATAGAPEADKEMEKQAKEEAVA